MNEEIFIEVLAEVCDEEIAELNKFPPFKPSLRHRYAMMLIFSSFAKRSRRMTDERRRASAAKRRPSRLSTKLIILIAVIVCAALLTGAILIYISNSFRGTVNEDNTRLFPINTENCPTTIEYEYYLPVLPDGFEMVNHDVSSVYIFTEYKNAQTGQIIALAQRTKEKYSRRLNTEDNNFEEIEVNGHKGIYIYFSDVEHIRSIVIWDNDDYIFELEGDLPKNELLDLAKSTKVIEN